VCAQRNGAGGETQRAGTARALCRSARAQHDVQMPEASHAADASSVEKISSLLVNAQLLAMLTCSKLV